MKILQQEDFKNAEILYEEERLPLINRETMFYAGIYCILATAEKYEKHISIYKKIEKIRLDDFKKYSSKLKKLLGSARFPNQKFERICRFANWWENSYLPEEIMYDVNNGRKKEFELRNRFTEEAPGIGYKGC